MIYEELTQKQTFEIVVKPNSNETKIYKEKEKYIAKIKKPAEDGKANEELLKHLKKQTKLQPKIIKGKNTRKKTIKIS